MLRLLAALLIASAPLAMADTPQLIKGAEPIYPKVAERYEIQGLAGVEATIGADGTVQDVSIILEDPAGYGFGEAAADTLRRSKFADGHPGVFRQAINFRCKSGQLPLPEFLKLPPLPAPLAPIRAFAPGRAVAAGVDAAVFAAVRIDAEGRLVEFSEANVIPGTFSFGQAAHVALAAARFPRGVPGLYRTELRIAHTDVAPPEPPSAEDLPKLPNPLERGQIGYPLFALVREVEGEAAIRVTIDAEGRVAGSGIVREDPTGYDFGLAGQIAIAEARFDAAPGDYIFVAKFRLPK